MTRFIDRGYTDWFVLVVHTLEEAQEFYEEILKNDPELFLGYNVILARCLVSDVQGLKNVADFAIQSSLVSHPDYSRVVDTLECSMLIYGFGFKVRTKGKYNDN